MGDAVYDDRMEARVGKEDLGNIPRCRIPFENCPNILV
jgi:hypothetical protein